MLIFTTPKHFIVLPFTVISALIDVVAKTILLAKDPAKNDHEFWMQYDPQERQRKVERVE